MSKLKKKQRKEVVRIIEYFISGGAYFWSGYGAFAILDKGFGLSLWWAKLIANVVGVTINFALNRFWVFGGRGASRHLTIVTEKYVIITLANFVIDYLIVKTLRDFGITPYLGQFVSAGFFTVWNYLWYRFWVFTRSRRKPARARS